MVWGARFSMWLPREVRRNQRPMHRTNVAPKAFSSSSTVPGRRRKSIAGWPPWRAVEPIGVVVRVFGMGGLALAGAGVAEAAGCAGGVGGVGGMGGA
jgi:hypothetical protein